jgi:hypothetical protein
MMAAAMYMATVGSTPRTVLKSVPAGLDARGRVNGVDDQNRMAQMI